MKKRYLYLLLWILGLECLGWISGSLTKDSVVTWYLTLNRSMLTPPSVVFPIVWGILYAFIGVIGWLIWQSNLSLTRVKAVFIIQLILNFLWTPVFFYWHWLWISVWVISVLYLTVLYLTVVLLTRIRLAGLLCVPYLIWLSLAVYLNYFITMNN